MTLTFFHSPGSCSIGIHLLLNEVGASFETRVVNVREKQQFKPEYLAVNPKGKVPALAISDSQTLTEFQAIAFWIANSFPAAGLWPDELIARTRTLEALDYIVASVHMRGFTFVKQPHKFHDDPAAQEAIKAWGRSEVIRGLRNLSNMLGEKDYLLGDFGLPDAALFYVLHWAELDGFDIPDNLVRCLARLRERPAVAQMRAQG
ncbi:glutathione S-transferase N-terminal domain-containing protein [Mesorhizobium sp. CAU 1741]|uniref:glutathione S-transferase family protein n=1 Tax=Mesorhizobium sp. CAU 1741 TaxID=3140366 RepID=UPI00325A7F8D